MEQLVDVAECRHRHEQHRAVEIAGVASLHEFAERERIELHVDANVRACAREQFAHAPEPRSLDGSQQSQR